MMKLFLLHLKRIYWIWMLAEAREFRMRLENTIVSERRRARDAVEHCELMESRAEIDIIAARSEMKLERV